MQDYFAKWGDEGEVDFAKTFSELIILTASRTLMGMPHNPPTSKNFNRIQVLADLLACFNELSMPLLSDDACVKHWILLQ